MAKKPYIFVIFQVGPDPCLDPRMERIGFKWCFAGVLMMPDIECWIGIFVIFRGSGQVLLRNPIFL